MNLILEDFFQLQDYHGKQVFKKTKVKLVLLTDINMLAMVQEGQTGGIFHALYGYAKANNKYIKYKKHKNIYIKISNTKIKNYHIFNIGM